MVSDRPSALDQVLDIFLYAPIGLVLTARDQLPNLVEKGRQRASGQVMVARMVGELAVRQGQREAEKWLRQAVGRTADDVPPVPDAPPPPPPPPPARPHRPPLPPGLLPPRPVPTWPSRATTPSRRRRWSSGWKACHPTSWRLSACTRPPPATAGPSSAGWRSSSPASPSAVEAARPATAGDVADLAQLCRQSLAELAAQDRGGPVFVAREARAEPVEESLRHDVLDPERLVVAGTVDGVVVGFGTGRTELLRNGKVLGVIHELFVDAEARGVGVGETMMAEMLEWFRQRRCAGVDATALPGLRETKNFFEGSGFSARLLVMHHRMEGP